MYDNYRQTGFIWGVLVGGTLATLTTLLFTTKKGKQLQRQMGDLYEDVEDSAKGVLADARDKVEETAEHAGGKIAQKIKHETHPVHHHATHHKDSK